MIHRGDDDVGYSDERTAAEAELDGYLPFISFKHIQPSHQGKGLARAETLISLHPSLNALWIWDKIKY